MFIAWHVSRQGAKVINDYWLLIIDDWLLIADVVYPRIIRMSRMSAGGRGLLLMIDSWCFLSTDYTDGTDSQDMGCAQIKSVESVESVGHEGCWGALKPTDYTDGTDVRRRMGLLPGNRYVQDWSCPWWMDMWGMCVFKTLVWGMVRDKTFPPVILVGCGRVGCPDN